MDSEYKFRGECGGWDGPNKMQMVQFNQTPRGLQRDRTGDGVE